MLYLGILVGILTAVYRFALLLGIMFAALLRIDVNNMPSWMNRVIYLESFNKGYYASIMVQHTHNNPVIVTFYNLIYSTTKPVNSNKLLSSEERNEMNR